MTERDRGHAASDDRAAGLGRWLALTWLVASLAFAALAAHALFFSAGVHFLVGGPGPWLTAPRPVDTQLVAVDPAAPPVHVFVHRFDASPTAEASLTIRALTDFEAELNGQNVAGSADSASWRQLQTVDVAASIRDGRNELRVSVSNPKGPPLLQARLELGARSITGNDPWQVVTPLANPRPAMLADDTRSHPDAHLLPEPGQILRQHAALAALGLALCMTIAFGLETLRPRWLRDQTVAAASAFATVLWLGVFVTKTSALPAIMGFDAPAHMHYIELIRSGLYLPLADEGFSTYHPPLAHALTALVAAIFGASPTGGAGGFAYRLVPFASGFACVIFAGLTARRLWPGDANRISVALLTASLLPVGVYMAAYLGNESMHAAWLSAALFVATRIMTDEVAQGGDFAWLGGLLGLALLTKFTSLALAPIVLGFVAVKLLFFEARPIREVATRVAGATAIAALLSGWFYVRNWIVFGDPVVWNLDIPGAASWWLQPGFHTPAWLLSFGEGVRNPFFAGFVSYWDGLYSTFWGDGLVAGMQSARTRHGAWNDSLALVGYWLAIPATGVLAYGASRALRDVVRTSAPVDRSVFARAMLATVAGALLASSFLISLRLPFYAQARASYLLAVIVPIAIFAADGFITIHERLPAAIRRPGRTLLWGVALALLLVLSGSYLL